MTPYEKDLVSATVKALVPVEDIIVRIVGRPLEEFVSALTDRIRIYRWDLTVRLAAKVKRICKEAGIEPRAVPYKILLPLLDRASLEDDEDLHDHWAALLATAADPRSDDSRIPAFIRILEQLSRADVLFIDSLYDYIRDHDQVGTFEVPGDSGFAFARTLASAGLTRVRDAFSLLMAQSEEDPAVVQADRAEINLILDSLVRLRLLEKRDVVSVERPRDMQDLTQPKLKTAAEYFLTTLGVAFVQACRKPKPVTGEPVSGDTTTEAESKE